jgi:hypothetical protein
MSAGRMIYLAAAAICLATPATAAEFELGFAVFRTNNNSGGGLLITLCSLCARFLRVGSR